MVLYFFSAKHLCIANILCRKTDKKKITYGSGYNESEIDFSIIGKGGRKILKMS